MTKGDKLTSGNFNFTDTAIESVKVIDVKEYSDEHGYFMEMYKGLDFAAGGNDCKLVQGNRPSITKGLLRGLHFQLEQSERKFVHTVFGEGFDMAVGLWKRRQQGKAQSTFYSLGGAC